MYPEVVYVWNKFCGKPDFFPNGFSRHCHVCNFKSLFIYWLKNCWRSVQFNGRLNCNKKYLRRVVEKAFALWSEQVAIPSLRTVKLVFKEASSSDDADITLMWAEGTNFKKHSNVILKMPSKNVRLSLLWDFKNLLWFCYSNYFFMYGFRVKEFTFSCVLRRAWWSIQIWRWREPDKHFGPHVLP